MPDGRRRYALVGAGARAEMFLRALAVDHADRAKLVALADANQVRMDAHNRWMATGALVRVTDLLDLT